MLQIEMCFHRCMWNAIMRSECDAINAMQSMQCNANTSRSIGGTRKYKSIVKLVRKDCVPSCMHRACHSNRCERGSAADSPIGQHLVGATQRGLLMMALGDIDIVRYRWKVLIPNSKARAPQSTEAQQRRGNPENILS